ncbi:13308_t:CDS:2 [Acaulospora colombiana]|uniref:13308_t:CDS:1 n=1 Tax=Acaulospora colombiana TaxID=27376 RepID=A0ACA9LS82_9GLOM|nr:13308_t:CDS:2 [Acaulospora colombiana]
MTDNLTSPNKTSSDLIKEAGTVVPDSSSSILTPEQRKRIEDNRLKAKNKLLERQKQQEHTNQQNSQGTLPPMKKFANYVEYDLSKMVDTRGGFLAEEVNGNSKKRKERALDPEEPAELNDMEVLPHLSRPNPHQSTWNDMMLYLREQVEEFAFNKWGGEEGLDKEFERREEEKRKKKDKKFKTKLADLRKRTRTEVLGRKREEHKHEFGVTVEDPQTGVTTQTCSSCGLKIEVTVF